MKNSSNLLGLAILAICGLGVYQNFTLTTRVNTLQVEQARQRAASRPPEIPIGAKLEPLKATGLDNSGQTLSWVDPSDPRPVLAYIFQPGCHWCVRNEANFETLYNAKKGQYRFVGLSPRLQGTAELPESKLGMPIYTNYQGQPAADVLRTGTPTMVLVEGGKIKTVWRGAWSPTTAKSIEDAMSIKLPGLTPEPTAKPLASNRFPVATAGFSLSVSPTSDPECWDGYIVQTSTPCDPGFHDGGYAGLYCLPCDPWWDPICLWYNNPPACYNGGAVSSHWCCEDTLQCYQDSDCTAMGLGWCSGGVCYYDTPVTPAN